MRPAPINLDHAWFTGKPRLPPTPPLVCDLCEWPVSINDLCLSPDGKIEGLIVCPQCIEDSLFGDTRDA